MVHRGQFFIDRLQFLLASFEFFGGGTHLLVHRLQLLVGSFQLFVSRFVLLHCRRELLFEELNLVVRILADRALCRRRRCSIGHVQGIGFPLE